MGQLEKYGLYVLCLVIFLILGVTIWGGGDLPVPARRGAQTQGSGLNANPTQPVGNAPPTTAPAAVVRPGDGNASVPDLSSLLRPVDRSTASRPPEVKTDAAKAGESATEPRKPDAGSAAPNAVGRLAGSGAVPATATKLPPTARPTYKVGRGDTFDSIAKEKLGNSALRTEIARLNPSVEPSLMKIGSEILLPTAAELADLAKASATTTPGVAQGSAGTYLVAKGDTFDSIARRELGSIKRLSDLREANPGIDPKSLRAGTTIRLPKR